MKGLKNRIFGTSYFLANFLQSELESLYLKGFAGKRDPQNC